MNDWIIFWSGILVLLVIAAVGLPLEYRRHLSSLKERAVELRANAQVARGKRRTLLEQLVALVNGFVGHERTVFADAGRTHASGTQAQLAIVTAAAQRFPELKANEAYGRLMSQLPTIEAELQRSLEEYNGAARVFNTELQSPPFPIAWIARLSGGAQPFGRPLEYMEDFE